MIKKFIQYAGLPFIFIFPIWLYALGSTSGHVSAWGIVASITGIVILLLWEGYVPSRTEWKPTWKHIKTDLQFLALIHLAFTELFGAGIVFFLISQFGTKAPLAFLWPGDWPIWGQVMMVVLISDFLRYWAHRALHAVPFFWRAHALHHSVDRLYSFNTLRFHPIEMILQYAVLSLPSILLGVDARVAGFWVVIHLLIAFVQHCNVNFYFGPWSKVVVTPELHRWHHSNIIEESNTNYAIAFCFWDMLFGTYYRPKDRQPGTLGIQGPAYPTEFLSQLKAPFMKSER